MIEALNGKHLFIHLLLQFRDYPDAAVLWIFLKNYGDEKEIHTTLRDMHFDELGETVPVTTIKRSIARLAARGFIKVRPHKNTRTLITVHREAVLELLRKPLINDFRLPGLSEKEFPFLDAWNEDLRSQQKDSVNPTEQPDAPN